jgi:hypothetical protein
MSNSRRPNEICRIDTLNGPKWLTTSDSPAQAFSKSGHKSGKLLIQIGKSLPIIFI